MKGKRKAEKKKLILIYIQRGKTKQEKGDFPAMNLIKKVCYTKRASGSDERSRKSTHKTFMGDSEIELSVVC